MEQKSIAAQQRGTSDAPTVLLAGFLPEEAESITTALNQMDWLSTCLVKEAEIEVAFGLKRFDVTVIDEEHLDAAVPDLIARLRATQGPSSDATILVVSNNLCVGFKDQMAHSGADLVVQKPSDPKMYMINFTRAATFRLKKIGTSHA